MKYLAAFLVLIFAVMAWQHLRYLKARREIVQDTQPLLYSSSTFHVLTFLDLDDASLQPEGREGPEVAGELIPRTRDLVRAITSAGGQLVYAGQAAFTRSSEQIGPRDWDAALLVQYPSRDAYDTAARSDGVRDALGAFSRSYSHGMQRSAPANLLLPQALLGLRIVDIVQGNWNLEELTPIALPEGPEAAAGRAQLAAIVAGLKRLEPVNGEALVVFNLIRPGNAAQEAANQSYGLKMIKRMAAGGHGPMHVGKAVTLEGDADFDQAIIVYYPGPGYFAKLLQSRFFQGIIGDKQLSDTQAVPTVPIRLQLRLGEN